MTDEELLSKEKELKKILKLEEEEFAILLRYNKKLLKNQVLPINIEPDNIEDIMLIIKVLSNSLCNPYIAILNNYCSSEAIKVLDEMLNNVREKILESCNIKIKSIFN